MELLKNNIENFKNDAKQYFKGNDTADNFKYRVATNFMIYNIEDVPYYPNDFKKSLQALYNNNLGSQLVEVFKNEFGYNLEEYLKQTANYEKLVTYSDAGSLKIGNKNFNILIPNGYGDGETEVFIIEQNIDIPLRYITLVEGEVEIFDYDCANSNVVTTIKGRYQIYSENGQIVFVKIS